MLDKKEVSEPPLGLFREEVNYQIIQAIKDLKNSNQKHVVKHYLNLAWAL